MSAKMLTKSELEEQKWMENANKQFKILQDTAKFAKERFIDL